MRQTHSGVLVFFASIVVLSLLAACADAQPGEAEASGPSPSHSGWDTLPDGNYSGYVIAFEEQAISFDQAEFLSDDEAPNGFRIGNPDTGELVLGVAPSATVALIDNTTIEHREVDLSTFPTFFEGALDWAYGAPSHLFASIELQEGLVVRVEEIYLP